MTMSRHDHLAAGEQLLAEANAALTRARGNGRAQALATVAAAHFAAARLAADPPDSTATPTPVPLDERYATGTPDGDALAAESRAIMRRAGR